MTIETINPATGQIIQSYPLMDWEQVQHIAQRTQQAFLPWRQVDFTTRSNYLRQIAKQLETHKLTYAQLIAQEMGKPIQYGQVELEKCASMCHYYADNGEQFLQDRPVQTEAYKSYVCYQPLGIVLGIAPWNYPFSQVFRFAIPNLMAGNAVLLSHAPIVTGSALAIETLIQQAGLPEHVFRTLVTSHDTIAQLIQHPYICGVTFTGSQRGGREVGAQTAKALKKLVLELGGSDPYIILADADLEQATDAVIRSRMLNSGQVCVSAKRIIIVESIYEAFEQLLLDRISGITFDDPLAKDATFGPMARADLRDTVHQQVQTCVKQGAELMTGGILPDGPGFYYPPTLLSHVNPGTLPFNDEIFGPVLCLTQATNEAEAIEFANDCPYGLSATVFTQDLDKG